MSRNWLDVLKKGANYGDDGFKTARHRVNRQSIGDSYQIKPVLIPAVLIVVDYSFDVASIDGALEMSDLVKT